MGGIPSSEGVCVWGVAPKGVEKGKGFLTARQGSHKQKRLFQAKVTHLWGTGWVCVAVTSSSLGLEDAHETGDLPGADREIPD